MPVFHSLLVVKTPSNYHHSHTSLYYIIRKQNKSKFSKVTSIAKNGFLCKEY